MRMLEHRIVVDSAETVKERAEMEAAEAQMATLEREQCIMTQAAMKAFVPDEMVFWSEE